MSQIDFYVLRASGEIARRQFVCRLAEKAYRLDNKVHIRVPDHECVKVLDDLLWTFRDGSFVPHEVANHTGNEVQSPVTIGVEAQPSIAADLLINLGSTLFDLPDSFPRAAEVVTSDEESLALCRQRFVDYRNQGHKLNTHKI